MEGDGELLKMLMQADPPDENIQGPMEDSSIVQSGGYAQAGMAFGSGHYGGMQQQLPTMGPQQQQRQRSSSFHSMNTGQMMQPDMDIVLQQQQYQQQQQQQQSAYGNGNYQGYNGGYQGPRPVSPQTHTQPMGPYQSGFPPEHGYSQGVGTSQAMGEFGAQTGPNQTMGMPGPASLSLANLSAMTNRQQYYSDGYGMNQPVSPVHKQMPQSGGFLQPSRVPYSQQAQSYPSGSYPKRPSPSPVQNQMQGFSSSGSFTSRSNSSMQMPNMPYQPPTSPYQPPRSPVMRSSTSPVPQQDAGLYSRPREPFPQPRSPFGSTQGQFQQQQQQHSSCMFIQRGTMPPQSQYQPQQQMVGTKSAGVAQRRASYPGQQSAMKMPSPPLKRSPPSPLPNSRSPDLARASQLGGFDERGPVKAATKKEKASSPPAIDPGQVATASKMKDALPKNASDGQKDLPRQRRSVSGVGSPSVSPPIIKKDGGDAVVPRVEEVSAKVEETVNTPDNVEMKEEDPRKSNGTAHSEIPSHSSKNQEGEKEHVSLDNKGNRPCSEITGDQTATETAKPENAAPGQEETPSREEKIVVTTKEECEEGRYISSNAKNSASNTASKETKNACVESSELGSKDGIYGSVNETTDVKVSLDTELSNVNGKGDELTNKTDEPSTAKEDNTTCEKADDRSCKVGDSTEHLSGESAETEDETRKPVSETGKTGEETNIPSEYTVSAGGKPSRLIDDELVKAGNEGGQPGKAGKSDHAGLKANPGIAEKTVDTVSNASEDNKANTVKKKAKEADGQFKEHKESVSKAKPLSNKLETKSSESNVESKKVPSSDAEEKTQSKTTDRKSGKTEPVQKKPAAVSLRCEERLSSDDDDQQCEVQVAPPVESRTQGMQTVAQTTVTPRSSHKQATSIKATIIAKGKSSHNNQQVMVAKTTTGQMYLIQGNILVPVQSVKTNGDASSKHNSKVIIVNPVKTAADQVGGVITTKGSDGKEKSESKTSKNTAKEKSAEESRAFGGVKKSPGSANKSDRSPNTKADTKSSHKSPVATGSKMPPSQSEKSSALDKEKATNQTESFTGKDSRNSPDKQKNTSSPNKNVTTREAATSPPDTSRRGRPTGSKDKQKRKSFVHKAKRTQDDVEVGANSERPTATRKFSKTASVVNEMSSSSSIEPSTSAKRPLGLDVPTVNASKSPKRRKVSTSGSPVKHIATRPRGGVDGDSWVCSLCGKRSGNSLLGDLYGPYKTKFAKEKTDNPPAKDGKLSQKLSSPGRKLGSSSDAPADRKSSSGSDVREDVETCDVDLWIHRDCGVWSPGVFMLGRTIHGLEQAVESAAQHKCTKCSEVGATLACFKRGCNKMFHFACARDSGCSFIEENFTIFCSTHKC